MRLLPNSSAYVSLKEGRNCFVAQEVGLQQIGTTCQQVFQLHFLCIAQEVSWRLQCQLTIETKQRKSAPSKWKWIGECEGREDAWLWREGIDMNIKNVYFCSHNFRPGCKGWTFRRRPLWICYWSAFLDESAAWPERKLGHLRQKAPWFCHGGFAAPSFPFDNATNREINNQIIN